MHAANALVLFGLRVPVRGRVEKLLRPRLCNLRMVEAWSRSWLVLPLVAELNPFALKSGQRVLLKGGQLNRNHNTVGEVQAALANVSPSVTEN